MAEAEHVETPAERQRRELDENEIRNGERMWSHEETGEPWRNPDAVDDEEFDEPGATVHPLDEVAELDDEVAE